MKVKVNIHNRGKLFGIVTPAYGIYLDSELVDMYLQMGFHIEVVSEQELDSANITPQIAMQLIDTQVKENKKKAEQIEYKKECAENYEENIDEMKKLVDDYFKAKNQIKDSYTEGELHSLNKYQLIDILEKRGHPLRYPTRNTPFTPDELAPKCRDTKWMLIDKVLKSNI